MVVGDPTKWVNRFRSLDMRFLQCVIAVWPKCLAVLPSQPDEDTITINLVDLLSKDQQARRLFHWLEFQYEPFGYTPDGTAYSKGKIDMAVLLDQERERYLAYECKRLNVVSNGKKSSLATPYVADGLSRFISEQYAEKLPVGCMLGYVLDGDLSGAQSKIYAAINTKKSHIGLKASPVQDQPVGAARRFFSHHLRPANGHEIEIRHALLPFPKISAAKAKPPKHVSPGSPMAVSE
jgi:hypothetical protein